MASRSISILESFLSGGNVGKSLRSSAKAILNASTRILSLVACAVRYFCVALRRLRRSSLLSAEFSWFPLRRIREPFIMFRTCECSSRSFSSSSIFSMLENVMVVRLVSERIFIVQFKQHRII